MFIKWLFAVQINEYPLNIFPLIIIYIPLKTINNYINDNY